MELRVIVLSSDVGLAELLRAQVENLGCACNVAGDHDEAMGALDWADAALVDLADGGLDALRRLRAEAPDLRTLAVAVDEKQAKQAREHADEVLVEPFAIPDLVQGVRRLQPTGSGQVIDLRSSAQDEADDAPWWATR